LAERRKAKKKKIRENRSSTPWNFKNGPKINSSLMGKTQPVSIDVIIDVMEVPRYGGMESI
jgi:hypothetical protein